MSDIVNQYSISIPELGDARVRRTSDERFSVYDIIKATCKGKDYYKTWERLKDRFPEVLTFCQDFKFPGKGQRTTPVTDKEGALKILGLLPGEAGRQYRADAAKLVARYLEADAELAINIIERNDNPDDLKRIEARAKGKIRRVGLTATYQAHGVEGVGYAQCTNATYLGAFGADKKELMSQRGLSKGNFRDHATHTELTTIDLSEDLTDKKIKKVNAWGNDQCADIAYHAAKAIADAQKTFLED